MGQTQSDAPIAADALPIVFIHGIKGSTLETLSGQCRYLQLRHTVVKSSASIALPTEWQPNDMQHQLVKSPPEFMQGRDDLMAKQPLTRLSAGCISVDVYAPFLDWAAHRSAHAFHPFAYDWRRDNHESIEHFFTHLTHVYDKHNAGNNGQTPPKKLVVVAHSMGGLITFATLRLMGSERARKMIHGVVFAGVPFGPGINFLSSLMYEDAVGRNTSLMHPRAFFTFSTGCVFFPLSDEEQEQGQVFLADENGKRIPMDFFNYDDWERLRLGLFAWPDLLNQPTETQKTHFKNLLATAKKFALLLRPEELKASTASSSSSSSPPASDSATSSSVSISSSSSSSSSSSTSDAITSGAASAADPKETKTDTTATTKYYKDWPRIAVLASPHLVSRGTMVKSSDMAPNRRGWDASKGTSRPGDGRVAYHSARPPAMNYRLYPANAGDFEEHSVLLNDIGMVSRIIGELCTATDDEWVAKLHDGKT